MHVKLMSISDASVSDLLVKEKIWPRIIIINDGQMCFFEHNWRSDPLSKELTQWQKANKLYFVGVSFY